MGIEYFDFSVSNTVARQINVVADFVRYQAGSAGGADESIIVKSAKGGIEVKLKPGQSFQITDKQDMWFVIGTDASTVIGELLFAYGGKFDDATVAGTVSIIEGGKNRTMAGSSMYGFVGCGIMAGNYSHVQLLNPVASQKNLFIEQILINSSIESNTFSIKEYETALTTLFGNGAKKNIGGGASVAELRIQNAEEFIGVKYIANLNEKLPKYDFKEPLLLKPGKGILVHVNSKATDVNATFEYFEEKI